MNKNNTIKNLAIVIIIVMVGIGIFLFINKKSPIVVPVVDQNQVTTPETPLVYKNDYGFNFNLPISWKGYSIIADKWNGQTLDTQKPLVLEGPKILIRHPLWTKEIPRQDIPIMIFTLAQWSLIQQEKLSVGAAPIGPSELGRNTNYVFALPARYNFAYQVGFEEVQKIIESKALSTF